MKGRGGIFDYLYDNRDKYNINPEEVFEKFNGQLLVKLCELGKSKFGCILVPFNKRFVKSRVFKMKISDIDGFLPLCLLEKDRYSKNCGCKGWSFHDCDILKYYKDHILVEIIENSL